MGIITYNRLQSLQSCLSTVRRHSEGYQLVVADDGSTDGTQSWCASQRIPCISGENRGIAANKNRALDALQDCDVIVLLEDDARIRRSGWLEFITQGMASSSNAHSLVVRRPTVYDVLEGPMVYCAQSNGFCMVFMRHVLDKVGGFDLAYGRYGYEHHDLSYRIWRAGLTRGVHPHVAGSEQYVRLDALVPSVLGREGARLASKLGRVLEDNKKRADEGDWFRPIVF